MNRLKRVILYAITVTLRVVSTSNVMANKNSDELEKNKRCFLHYNVFF